VRVRSSGLAEYWDALWNSITTRVRRSDPLPFACVVAAGIIGLFLVYMMVAFYDRDPVSPVGAAPDHPARERLVTGDDGDPAEGADRRGSGSRSGSRDRNRDVSSTTAGQPGTTGSAATGSDTTEGTSSSTSRATSSTRPGTTGTTAPTGTTGPGSSSTTTSPPPTTDPPLPTTVPPTTVPPLLPDAGKVLGGLLGVLGGLL
jgi:hypothetical protein